jgi:hypothetical protein
MPAQCCGSTAGKAAQDVLLLRGRDEPGHPAVVVSEHADDVGHFVAWLVHGS